MKTSHRQVLRAQRVSLGKGEDEHDVYQACTIAFFHSDISKVSGVAVKMGSFSVKHLQPLRRSFLLLYPLLSSPLVHLH